MARLYRRAVNHVAPAVDPVTLGCYSERGLMSYFMFRVLPGQLTRFLHLAQSPDPCGKPFANMKQVQAVTLFSELDFGNQGFGKPDGAISFTCDNQQYLIMIEVKLNQSYAESCTPTARYNSTIKGQLELKWRLMTILKSCNPMQSVMGVNYVIENDHMISAYRILDPQMYPPNMSIESLGLRRRRLRPVEGVGEFIRDFVNPCDFTNIFYLALTADHNNPLDMPCTLRPKCHDACGAECPNAMRQFCWINAQILEN